MRLYSEWIEDQGRNNDDFGESETRRRPRPRQERRRRKKLVRRRSRQTTRDRDDRDDRDEDRPRRRRKKMKKVRRKRRMPDGRIIEVIEMIEEELPEEFPVDEDLEAAIDDAEAAPDDEGAVEDLGAALRDGWGQIARVGNLRIQPKAGMRAAVMELKPGLYVVAEVPEKMLDAQRDDFGFVPLAIKMTKAVKHAIDNPPNQVGASPSWRERAIERKCRCRWEQE